MPKITPSSFDKHIDPIIKQFIQLETELFVLIAERLKTNGTYAKDEVLQWQTERLNELGLINNETIRLLSKMTGKTQKEIEKALDEVSLLTLQTVDEQVEENYEEAKRVGLLEAFAVLAAMEVFEPLPIPKYVEPIKITNRQRLYREINAFIQESLITTNLGTGTVARTYRNIINQTTSRVLAGEMTINQAIIETVVKWSRQGMATGFVDRGGNVWGLERYAETLIRATVKDVYNEITLNRMSEYGTDLALMSSLGDPREACSHIQGKVVYTKESELNTTPYPSIYDYGYGRPEGTLGINCRHRLFPWFDGISENNQPQYTEEEMTKGRIERQKQRYHERQIRQAKQELEIAKTVGDEHAIRMKQRLLRNRQARMREFIKETGRKRFYDRERVVV